MDAAVKCLHTIASYWDCMALRSGQLACDSIPSNIIPKLAQYDAWNHLLRILSEQLRCVALKDDKPCR